MSRNIALDILKLTLAFMVIGLHSGFLAELTSLGNYLTVNGIFRIAVPLFLLINGFYFYPILMKNTHKTWFKRVFTLYGIWMAFYAYFWLEDFEMSYPGFAHVFEQLVVGYHHLWYISSMIGAALLVLLMKQQSSWLMVASIFVTFICGVIIQYTGNYHILDGAYYDELFNNDWAHRNMLFFSYPFFCTGYLIHKHSLHTQISFRRACIISSFGLLLLLAESYFNYYQEGRVGGFDNLASLLLICPFIFLVFMKSNIAGSGKEIALYSSAIYFIHSFVLTIFFRLTDMNATILTLATIALSAFFAYFIIKINEKVKYLL